MSLKPSLAAGKGTGEVDLDLLVVVECEVVAGVLLEVDRLLVTIDFNHDDYINLKQQLIQMRRQEKTTNYDKRKLNYDPHSFAKLPQQPREANPLDLPFGMEKKISATEHRKLREAFFIEADRELTIT